MTPPKTLAADNNGSWRNRLINANMKSVLVAAFCGAVLLFSACGSNREAENSVTPLSLSDQIALSRQDLARRQDNDVSTITLVAARHVTWRSGALGCPQPGMSYTQALVPGVLIILQAGNENFSYHAENDGIPFYCPRERIEVPASIEVEDLA